jgi:hypothetical protein
MKKNLFILALLFIMFSKAAAQEHGIILSSAYGKVNMGNSLPPATGAILGMWDFNYNVGYRYTKYFENKFSADFSALYGYRRIELLNGYANSAKQGSYLKGNSVSLGAALNYELFKNFSIGLGIDPTWYVSLKMPNDGKTTRPFDLPVVGKISYAFKYFEVELAYKQGTCNIIDSYDYAKTRDVQLSIFVPIFR